MPSLTYAGVAYQAAPEETVLDTLLRNGVPVAHSCRAGACQSCLLRASGGQIPAAAQKGLKPTLIEQGYFHSCVCLPEGDLDLAEPGGLDVSATLECLELLTPTVLRVRLRTATPFSYRAGQFVTLIRPDGLSRSYSLASLPEDDTLELHIRRAPMGQMSGWLFDHARAGDSVTLRGPSGDCFYTAGQPDQPLLLAGTGTGLAPLAGICRDALRQGHRGLIRLYHGSVTPDGLYLRDELAALARDHANVEYSPVVLQNGDGLETGAIDGVIGRKHPKLAGWRGFVCGAPDIVQKLKKKLFLAGMASREIFADAFVEATVP